MNKARPKKLYCYVDESGQDTKGSLYVVSVVVTGSERDECRRICEQIEEGTGKRGTKWIKTAYPRRVAFIKRVLETPIFRGKLSVAVYRHDQAYVRLTVDAIALTLAEEDNYEANILIDALPRSSELQVGLRLRRMGIKVKQVKGVRKEENEALIRLADAICGFARGAIEGQPAMKELFEKAVEMGVVRFLPPDKKMPP